MVTKIISNWKSLAQLREELLENRIGQIAGMDIIPQPLAQKLLEWSGKEIYLPLPPEVTKMAGFFSRQNLLTIGPFSFVKTQLPLLVTPVAAEGDIYYT